MPSYTDKDIANAYLDVTDNKLSIRQAAQKNGIPYTTLNDRLKGIPSKEETIQTQRRLTEPQEKRLVEWIIKQESLGYAPTYSAVCSIAAALCKEVGDLDPIGKNWITGFKARNPAIRSKVGKRMEAAQFNGFTPKAVNWYFDIREKEYGWINPRLTFNVDKAGIMAGVGKKTTSIISSITYSIQGLIHWS